MDLKDIEAHWRDWALTHKKDLKATTKTPTIKQLEINALTKTIRSLSLNDGARILEVGCGNGHNCLPLAKTFPQYQFTGLDFVDEMIENANELLQTTEDLENLTFFQGNILDLEMHPQLNDTYDLIFTDRCLINLNSSELHHKAIDQISKKLKPDGYALLIENVKQCYDRQNDLREKLGLPRRTPDPYNLFIDEEAFFNHATGLFDIIKTEDFACFHDLLLYVLVPHINNGEIDYAHPLVTAATHLTMENDDIPQKINGFGQNRLFLFQKKYRTIEHPKKPLTVACFFARHHGLEGFKTLVQSPDYQVSCVFTHQFKPSFEDPKHGEREEYQDFVSLCREHNIPLYCVNKKSEQSIIKQVLNNNIPDLIAVISWRMLIDKEIVYLPKIGAVNLHRGKLPEYQGVFPIAQALNENREYVVITAHELTEKIDAGEIISTQNHPVNYQKNQTLEENEERLKKEITPLFGPLLLEALGAMLKRKSIS